MLPSISKLCSKHGIIPNKKYGQNFLFDQNLCDKIVSCSQINKYSNVVEVGPGTAGLTRSILCIDPKYFTVIETDDRFLPLLREVHDCHQSFDIIHADALKFNLLNICNYGKLDVVSNLPYNIGTELILKWINNIEIIKSITVMLQKEVVDRIISKTNNKSYGRLSVICQATCNVQKCFDVSPNAFYPKPKIWSSIVRLVPKTNQLDKNLLKSLEIVTFHAFSERRKMIKSSLKKISRDIEKTLSDLNIDSSFRAESLTSEDYLKIAKSI